MDWKQVYSQTSELFNRFAAAGAPSMPVRDWPAVVTWSGKEWPGLYQVRMFIVVRLLYIKKGLLCKKKDQKRTIIILIGNKKDQKRTIIILIGKKRTFV